LLLNGGLLSETALASFIEHFKSIVVIPDTSLDSILAASIIYKKLLEHGVDVKISLNYKLIIDYPSDPAILINLPALNKNYHLSITRQDENSSMTGIVLSILDKLVGIDTWDRLLGVLGGAYRGLYSFKKGGFLGVEEEYLKSLVNEKVVVEIAGLRFWGAKRLSLYVSMARTLAPFIQGYTGRPESALKLIEELFKVQDPRQVKIKEIKPEEPKEHVLQLIKKLSENSKDPNLPFMLLGDFYINLSFMGLSEEVELHELLGSLIVYNSLCRRCPEDLLLVSIDRSIVSHVMSVYNEKIDIVAREVADVVEALKRGTTPPRVEVVERPDLVVDVLLYMGWLPSARPVELVVGRASYTVLRELLRTGYRLQDAITQCEEDQLCVVKR
jgi:single-stranded-DNA-specific exonuclease